MVGTISMQANMLLSKPMYRKITLGALILIYILWWSITDTRSYLGGDTLLVDPILYSLGYSLLCFSVGGRLRRQQIEERSKDESEALEAVDFEPSSMVMSILLLVGVCIVYAFAALIYVGSACCEF